MVPNNCTVRLGKEEICISGPVNIEIIWLEGDPYFSVDIDECTECIPCDSFHEALVVLLKEIEKWTRLNTPKSRQFWKKTGDRDIEVMQSDGVELHDIKIGFCSEEDTDDPGMEYVWIDNVNDPDSETRYIAPNEIDRLIELLQKAKLCLNTDIKAPN